MDTNPLLDLTSVLILSVIFTILAVSLPNGYLFGLPLLGISSLQVLQLLLVRQDRNKKE